VRVGTTPSMLGTTLMALLHTLHTPTAGVMRWARLPPQPPHPPPSTALHSTLERGSRPALAPRGTWGRLASVGGSALWSFAPALLAFSNPYLYAIIVGLVLLSFLCRRVSSVLLHCTTAGFESDSFRASRSGLVLPTPFANSICTAHSTRATCMPSGV